MSVIGCIKEFNPNEPNSWDNYSEQLSYFLEANSISDAGKKRATLLAVIGAKTLSIVRSLIAPFSPTTKSYEELCLVLKNHFLPQPSEIYRRFCFQKRLQNANEDISSYVLELRRLADDCNFGSSLNERLRDQLVVGLRDESLQRRLLAETTLTFDDAVSKSLASEIAERQTRSIHSPAENNSSAFLIKKHSSKPSFSKGNIVCFGCGGSHSRDLCNFKSAICRSCGKKGHIQRVCRSKGNNNSPQKLNNFDSKKKNKTIPTKVSLTDCIEYNVLNATNSVNAIKFKQSTTVYLNGKSCIMEVDSGSDYSIVSYSTLKELFNSNLPDIQEVPFRLCDYQKNLIELRGMCFIDVQYGNFNEKLRLLVTKQNHSSILGFEWFKPLGIQLTGIHNTESKDHFLDGILEEFKHIFDHSLGSYKGPVYSLPIDPTVPPIRCKARKVPLALKQKIDVELDKLLKQGVIEPIQNPKWCTPVVPVLKKSGEVRLCGDYKITINTAMKSHPYPIPSVQNILSTITHSAYFAKIDLAQAYLQVLVDDESAEAQTIITHRGAFKVKRLQFGVSVAPGAFQSIIEEGLLGIEGVAPYFDDILLFAQTQKELADLVRKVLQRLSDLGLKARKEKCVFGTTSIDFLGYTIDGNGIHPSVSKIEAIQEAPAPKNRHELESFLGLVNFYNCFLKGKTDIAHPLYELLKKDEKFNWCAKHDKSFRELKKLLSSDLVLIPYNEKLPLVLTCDASAYGIGSVLSNRLEDGREAPICFSSRTLTSAEKNYAQIDKEALSIIAGVKKFHHFLYGRNFTIVTDHKPLISLFNSSKPTPDILSPRMLRWSLLLNAYDFEIVYRSGKQIQNADALSRLPRKAEDFEEPVLLDVLFLETLDNPPLLSTDISKMSVKDPVLAKVLHWSLRGWPSSCPNSSFQPYFSRRHELSVHKKCLLWGNRVIIPEVYHNQVLKELHIAHPGIERMKALARSYVWWPNIDSDIARIVAGCHICQISRHAPPRAPVHHWEPTKEPWSRLHIDYAGPFFGKHFLIVVDSFSKWLEIRQVSTASSSATADVLRGLFATHGLPDSIVSDNATCFTSDEFRKFLRNNAIRQVLVAPYHPSSNGQAERMVQTAKDALKRLICADATWKQRISCYLLRQHITPSTATGFCPAELLLKRKPKTLLDRIHPDYDNCQRSKNLVNDADIKTRHFSPADPAFIRNFGRGDAWIPAVVESANGPCSYTLQTPDGRSCRRHVDHMHRRLTEVVVPKEAVVPNEANTSAPSEVTDYSHDSAPDAVPDLTDSANHSSPSISSSPVPAAATELSIRIPRRSGRQIRPPERFQVSH